MPSIVGTWKLLHATARDAAGTARPLPYGGKALGRVTFTADGRMMRLRWTEGIAGRRRPGIQLLLRQLHL
jgi:Lipocalin-like domain